jgi:hypothetical protein
VKNLLSTSPRNDRLLGALLAVFAFAVYLATLSPAIQYEDCGELAAAFRTLGIAHPTGYPLLSLLAGAFSRLPLGGTVIFRMNLLMALLVAASVYFFFRAFRLLLSESDRIFPAKNPPVPMDPVAARVASAAAALALAFSRTFWSEALSLEVYAFHLFFLALTLRLFLAALADVSSARRWRLFAYALGLSFANHMMTVLLAPAFLFAFFAAHGSGRAAWARIGRAMPPFLLGLTPYLYLPIRASTRPLMNWGDPTTWDAFLAHLSAHQFRYQMFTSADAALGKLGGFLSGLSSETGIVTLALAAFGAFALLRRSARALVFVLLILAACLFYTVNYAFDDPNYYTHAYVALAVLAGAGAAEAWRLARRARLVGALLCAALAFAPLLLNYRAVDQRGNYAVEDYARNVLESASPGAVILAMDWEYVVPVAYYLQLVEGVRPDVSVVSGAMLKFPWYHAQLERQAPDLARAARAESEAFIALSRGLEDGASTDTAAYWEALNAVTRAVVWNVRPARPVHLVTNDLDIAGSVGPTAVPAGATFRLFADSAQASDSGVVASVPAREPVFHPLVKRDRHVEAVRNLYAMANMNLGLRAARGARLDHDAAYYADKALQVKPGFGPALELRRNLGPR